MLTNNGEIGVIDNVEGSIDIDTGTINNQSGGTLTNNFIIGTRMINNSGTLTNDGIIAARTINNDGTLTNNVMISASTINNSGEFLVTSDGNVGDFLGGGDSGTFTQTAGSLRVDGFMMAPEGFDIQGGSLSGTGILVGSVLLGVDASLNPGNSPGTLTINGDLSISGILNIEIASLTSFDILNVLGTTTFESGCRVVFSFIESFLPTPGDTFNFLASAVGIDGFDLARFSFADPAFNLNVSTSATGGLLQVAFVDSGAGSGQAPEPATWSLLGLGLVGLGWRLRRQAA